MKNIQVFCPDCKEAGDGNVILVVRENKLNGSEFLGCPNYPECRYTRPIPEEFKMRALGQKGLFDD